MGRTNLLLVPTAHADTYELKAFQTNTE